MLTASFIDKIGKNFTEPKLTASQKKVAEYIQNNMFDASFQTIEQIAVGAKTSTGSVVRLATALGYSCFSEFIKELQRLTREQYLAHNIFQNKRSEMEHGDLLEKVRQVQINNINNTADVLKMLPIDQIVDKTFQARRIYVAGFRMSYVTAFFLNHYFNRILGNSTLLTPGSGGLPETIIQIGPDDVLYAIAFPRYARPVLDAAYIANRQGATVISITDGVHSLLAPYSDYLIPCANTAASFFNSSSGAMLAAEYLVSRIALYSPEDTRRRLEECDELLGLWNYHQIGHNPL